MTNETPKVWAFAWIAAVVTYVAAVLTVGAVMYQSGRYGGPWECWMAASFAAVFPAMVPLVATLIVYGPGGRRG
jgi:hypothetical protein